LSLQHDSASDIFTARKKERAMRTILIKSGRIVDGTGKGAYTGHVLVEGSSVREIIESGTEPPEADEVIDASGCVISPGFIDMHSHSDWVLPLEDHEAILKCLVEQGITTVVAGNCGFSPAPFNAHAAHSIAALEPLLERPLNFTWQSMGQFLDTLDGAGLVVNCAELVGHSTLRVACANTRRGAMSPAELATCLDGMRRSFDDGACGLSLGLGYDPAMFSPLEEIEVFSRVASQYGRPVTVHLKALSVLSPTYPLLTLHAHNLLALEEMIGVAKRTGARLQISHFIFVGRRSWGTSRKALRMVEEASEQGVDVMFDAFPYTCGNTTINAVIPSWFLAKTPGAYRSRVDRTRLRIEREAGFFLVGFNYEDIQVMDPAIPGAEHFAGLTISQIAERLGIPPFDAFVQLSEESGGGTLVLIHTYSGEAGRREVIDRVLSNRLCLFETDTIAKSTGYPNPAGMGTFPFILGPLARDRKIFSLEQAVQRSTLSSAERFHLPDRGKLAKGMAADLVVFDPELISDTPPDGPLPAGKPKGIRHVFINGVHVVEDGQYAGSARAGRVLRI